MSCDANWGDHVPLLCFPHAGAGRLYYARWGALFGDGISFEVVQYPERENRYKERMPATVQQLATDIHAEYARVFAGPYSIWGHSMGTVIGYEVAKLAQRLSGRAPLVFFSSGSAAPCESRFEAVPSLSSALDFRKVLLRYGGVSPENMDNPDFMNYFAPIIKADLMLLGQYQDVEFERLNCSLVLMEGRDDPVRLDSWPRYVARAPEVHLFDGGHFFLQEHSAELAALMSSRIQWAWQLAPTFKG